MNIADEPRIDPQFECFSVASQVEEDYFGAKGSAVIWKDWWVGGSDSLGIQGPSQ